MRGIVSSYASITPDEFISPTGTLPHPGKNIFDIPRESVYPAPYRPFGKMGNVEKLLFSTTSLAIQHAPVPESTGIVLITPNGSLATDCAYMNSVRDHFPRPALFAATLPSAPIAELAIPFTLRGPNRVIAGENAADGVLNALMLLNRKDTDTIITVYCDPDPLKGYAAALILRSEGPGFGEIYFSPEKCKKDFFSDVFKKIIASFDGRNNFPELHTNKGTIKLKERL